MLHLLLLGGVVLTAWLVNKKSEDTEESLFKLGNRLRTLEDDVQELKLSIQTLEAKLDEALAGAAAKKTPAKKKAAKKS